MLSVQSQSSFPLLIEKLAENKQLLWFLSFTVLQNQVNLPTLYIYIYIYIYIYTHTHTHALIRILDSLLRVCEFEL
jgi:hypothetical protein